MESRIIEILKKLQHAKIKKCFYDAKYFSLQTFLGIRHQLKHILQD